MDISFPRAATLGEQLRTLSGAPRSIGADPIENLPTPHELPHILRTMGVRAVLLDWDGCVMKNTVVHATVALEAARQSTLWQRFCPDVSLADADAAYRGDRETLLRRFYECGGSTVPSYAPHGVPWDTLMATNLVSHFLTARGASAAQIRQAVEEFLAAVPAACERLERSGSLAKVLNPQTGLLGGCREFLEYAHEIGLPVHVVTMTPTPLTESFARLLGVRALLGSISGCDQFSRQQFPNAKLDTELWISAALRQGLALHECAVVEDNAANVSSACRGGVRAIIALSKEAAVAASDPEYVQGVHLAGGTWVCSGLADWRWLVNAALTLDTWNIIPEVTSRR